MVGTKPFSFEAASSNTAATPSSGLFAFGKKSNNDNVTIKPASPATFSFGGKTDPPPANPASTFTFGKTAPSQEPPKADAPFSFSATSNKPANTSSTLVPQSTASGMFSFGGTESKPKESNIFSFGNSASNSTQATGGIFSFGGSTASSQVQGSTAAPKQPDVAPAAPFQFSGSTSLPPSAPQKAFSFGQTGSSNTSEPFKFGGTTSGSSNTSGSQATSFGAAKPSTFGAPSTTPFGSTSAAPKPASATPSLFQFGQSSSTNTNNPQPSATGSAGSGIFSFGGGSTTSTANPFAAPSQPAPPAFNATSPASNPGGSSQPNTGFNFAANANTAVPGVFAFGASSSSQQAPPPASSSFSFGGAIANAPTFGATSPTMGQPAAPQAGNMFSIGSSGNSANKPGRTFRTATRRRPK